MAMGIDEGYPIEMVIPDYAGFELEANGLMKGAKSEDAKRFLD